MYLWSGDTVQVYGPSVKRQGFKSRFEYSSRDCLLREPPSPVPPPSGLSKGGANLPVRFATAEVSLAKD